MSGIPGVSLAVAGYERPAIASREQVAGAPWSHDWRDIHFVAPDMIHNHDQPAYLGEHDATEAVNGWNPWEGQTGPTPGRVIRYGYAAHGIQEHRQAAPLAIDTYERDPSHGQATLSGVSSVAALVPFLSLPDHGQDHDASAIAGIHGDGEIPYHFDYGAQIDMGQAIGPRQVFRSPPSISDQTAAIYAAGF